jgi:hypothetical protein
MHIFARMIALLDLCCEGKLRLRSLYATVIRYVSPELGFLQMFAYGVKVLNSIFMLVSLNNFYSVLFPEYVNCVCPSLLVIMASFCSVVLFCVSGVVLICSPSSRNWFITQK